MMPLVGAALRCHVCSSGIPRCPVCRPPRPRAVHVSPVLCADFRAQCLWVYEFSNPPSRSCSEAGLRGRVHADSAAPLRRDSQSYISHVPSPCCLPYMWYPTPCRQIGAGKVYPFTRRGCCFELARVSFNAALPCYSSSSRCCSCAVSSESAASVGTSIALTSMFRMFPPSLWIMSFEDSEPCSRLFSCMAMHPAVFLAETAAANLAFAGSALRSELLGMASVASDSLHLRVCCTRHTMQASEEGPTGRVLLVATTVLGDGTIAVPCDRMTRFRTPPSLLLCIMSAAPRAHPNSAETGDETETEPTRRESGRRHDYLAALPHSLCVPDYVPVCDVRRRRQGADQSECAVLFTGYSPLLFFSYQALQRA